MASTQKYPPKEILDEAVRRIIEVADPEQIILFGSGARGEMGEESDLDLLIVKDAEDLHQLSLRVHERLSGLGLPKDVVLVSPNEVVRYKNVPSRVLYPALREGRSLYTAPGSESFLAADRPWESHEPEWPLGEPQEGLRRARSNLAIARSQPEGALPVDLAFDLHHAIEKILKAVMIQRHIIFPYTLSISKLIEAFEVAGGSLPDDLQGIADLAAFKLDARYPASGKEVTREQFLEALASAEKLFLWAETQLRS